MKNQRKLSNNILLIEKSKYNLLENKLNANLKFYSFFNKQFFLKPEETTI